MIELNKNKLAAVNKMFDNATKPINDDNIAEALKNLTKPFDMASIVC